MIITIILIISTQLSPLPNFSNHHPRCLYFTAKHEHQLKCSLALFPAVWPLSHVAISIFMPLSPNDFSIFPNPRSSLNCNLLPTSFPRSRTYSQCSPQPKFTEVQNKTRATQLVGGQVPIRTWVSMQPRPVALHGLHHINYSLSDSQGSF